MLHEDRLMRKQSRILRDYARRKSQIIVKLGQLAQAEPKSGTTFGIQEEQKSVEQVIQDVNFSRSLALKGKES